MEYNFERYVLKTAAIATLLIGLGLIFFTTDLIRWFDSSKFQDRHFAIYLGTALCGFAVMNWLYSYSHNLGAIKPALIGNLASLLIASIIDVTLLAAHETGPAILIVLAIHLAFSLVFAYCLMSVNRKNA